MASQLSNLAERQTLPLISIDRMASHPTRAIKTMHMNASELASPHRIIARDCWPRLLRSLTCPVGPTLSMLFLLLPVSALSGFPDVFLALTALLDCLPPLP